MKEKIERTVKEILEESDMTEMTEFKVRKLASERLGIDLSEKSHKTHVRSVVNKFLAEHRENPEEVAEEEEEGGAMEESRKGNKEFDDDGDLIICRVWFRNFTTRASCQIKISYLSRRMLFFDSQFSLICGLSSLSFRIREE